MDFNRYKRGVSQRLYLLERSEDGKEFQVIGSTGNVYKVVNQDEKWHCSCPDSKFNKRTCKHCYFVIYRCLEKVEEGCKAPIQIVYEWKKRKLNHTKEIDESKKKPTKEEICVICMEELDTGEDLSYCLITERSCGKAVHSRCFDMWLKKGKKTCVYCRESMVVNTKDEYINLKDKLV